MRKTGEQQSNYIIRMYIYIYVLQTFQSRSQTTNWSKGANHSFEQVAMPLSQAIGGWAIVYFFNVTRFGLADLGTLLTLPIFRHPGQAAFSHLPQTEIVVLFLRCCMYICICTYIYTQSVCVWVMPYNMQRNVMECNVIWCGKID